MPDRRHVLDAQLHSSRSVKEKLTKIRLELRGQRPVSYTHLDVYKRQGVQRFRNESRANALNLVGAGHALGQHGG